MGYIQGSIKDYLKDLAAKKPAPGGGSVAALSCAMAASLVAMASEFTLGKEKYKKVGPRFRQILLRSLALQKRLAALTDADIRAYRKRDLDQAIRIPAEVCVLSYEILELGLEVLKKGNRLLASDAYLAVLLAQASFVAGLMYVEVNLKYAKDKAKKYEKTRKTLKKLFLKTQKIAKKVEVSLGSFIGR
jgi:formiminotetrahydrofolate cyclodeaminase